jgi:hypothetical protein
MHFVTDYEIYRGYMYWDGIYMHGKTVYIQLNLNVGV